MYADSNRGHSNPIQVGNRRVSGWTSIQQLFHVFEVDLGDIAKLYIGSSV